MLRFFFFGFVILVFVSNGCGENENPDESEALMTEVQINLQITNLAPFNSVSTITVTVMSGPNDNTVLAQAPMTTQGNTATAKVSVLAGKNRVFKLEAKDKDGNVIGSGTAMTDVVAGKANTVDITIQFVTGDVVVNAHWEDQPTAAEIIPGEKVAGIELLSPYSNAKELYGVPVIDPEYPDIFMYEKIGLMGLTLDLNGNKRIDDNEPIILMMVTEPYSGKTAGGNGIGSTRADVEREFGATTDIELDEEGNMEIHIYENKGVDFFYDVPTRSVVAIDVYPVIEAAPGRDVNKINKRGLRIH